MTDTNTTTQGSYKHYIEEVSSLKEHSYTALVQLEAIFGAIADKAKNDGSISKIDIKNLSDAGAYLAMDQANMIDGTGEILIDKLKNEVQS